jgi:hypothetical protein
VSDGLVACIPEHEEEGTCDRYQLALHPKPRVLLKSAVTAPKVADHWMGGWYATLLPWRPQMVLLVNEQTLLPVLVPLAPAATLTTRIPGHVRPMLDAIGVPTLALEEPPRQF